MGSNSSKPADLAMPPASAPTPSSSGSACPVKHTNNTESTASSRSACPIPHGKKEVETKANNESACPVKHKDGQVYKNPSVFNVYSTKIDPTNQMPANANQQPSANQQMPLSVDRVPSSIPKGGTEQETWTYPSPQMFWNALVRKDKTEGVLEQDMETVIAIHNNMNEHTWQQVVEWEKLVNDPAKAAPGRESKLLKFCGRPDELSPKARLKVLFGHPAPFDRHDWTVDRGGKMVRYIIDYYHDESAVQQDKKPRHMTDAASMQSIKVDVRPALDDPSSILARLVLMPWRQFQGATKYNPPPFFAPKVMIQAEEGKLQRINSDWKEIANKCAPKKAALAECASEESCRAASVALQVCTASVVCPSLAAAFLECTSATSADGKKQEVNMAKAGAAFSDVIQCLELFEIDSKKAMGLENVDLDKKKADK
eukprot:gene14549-16701_t